MSVRGVNVETSAGSLEITDITTMLDGGPLGKHDRIIRLIAIRSG
jgi:hypothetical protein